MQTERDSKNNFQELNMHSELIKAKIGRVI